MTREKAFRTLMVLLLWLVIAGVLGVSYRYLVSAEMKEKIEGVPVLTDTQWDQLLTNDSVQASPIRFARGSADLSDSACESLREIARALKAVPKTYARVIGNSRERSEPDLLLARSRAANVTKYLQSQGLSANQMRIESAISADAELLQSVTFMIGQAQ